MSVPAAVFPPTARETNTLSWLVEHLQEAESRENPDIVISLDQVRLTAAGNLNLPSLQGDYALTDWSRTQLSRLVGLASWDRWFVHASGSERAEEMNRRLARASGTVRVRSVKHRSGATEAEGAVRAIMSPRYTPVSDAAVARTLQEALGEVESEPMLARSNMTELSTSYVVKLGKPFRAGDGGEVGEVWGGLMVRNSGVGYTRLSVSLSLVRLICLNGMAAPVPDGVLVRSVHRGIDLGRVREQIVAGLDGVTARLHRSARVLDTATRQHVEDAEREVRELLRRARLPLGLMRDVMDAYAKEPRQSRFGVSQALTLAAQRVSPEVRFDLERIAGQYLAEAS